MGKTFPPPPETSLYLLARSLCGAEYGGARISVLILHMNVLPGRSCSCYDHTLMGTVAYAKDCKRVLISSFSMGNRLVRIYSCILRIVKIY